MDVIGFRAAAQVILSVGDQDALAFLMVATV
jgi:hypothetical protein